MTVKSAVTLLMLLVLNSYSIAGLRELEHVYSHKSDELAGKFTILL